MIYCKPIPKGGEKLKKLFALLLIIVMMVSLAACGRSNGPDEPGNEPGNEPGEEPTGLEGDYYSYEGDNAAFLMILDFKELRFDWKDEDSAYTYAQKFIAEDEVDGVPGKKFEVTIDENGEKTSSELWIGSDGTLLKAGSEGSYATGDMAFLHAFGAMMYAIPVYAYTGSYAESFKNGDFDRWNWHVSERATVSKDFGDGNVPVERYVFTYTSSGETTKFEWELAKVGGKYLFTKWKLDYNDNHMDMTVDRIITF